MKYFYQLTNVLEKSKMKNRRQENWLIDYCSSCGLFIFFISAFFILFTYTEDSLSAIPNTAHVDIAGMNDFDEGFYVQDFMYECKDNKCVRSTNGEMSFNTCNMLCSYSSLWPEPNQRKISNRNSSIIEVNKISFLYDSEGRVGKMLKNVTDSFRENLELLKSGNQFIPGTELNITVAILDKTILDLKINTKESYQIKIEKNDIVNVLISSDNFFGARHAFETLYQLIWLDAGSNTLRILHDEDIKDGPQFPYRGVMIDTARNYMPLPLLRKVIDGMAMTKLNVLHLHLTDAVSFPIVLPSIQQLASYGAYGTDMIYTASDIKNLIEYAILKGVRIVLEVDAPSHVNSGWNSFSDDYVICGESDILNGHLNPDNNDALTILEMIYEDLLQMNTNTELFHIGGDEVNLTCWENTKSAKGVSMKKFWANYTNKMLEKLKKANNGIIPENVIMWSSPLTESREFHNLNIKVTVQQWLGSPQNVLINGNKIIYSTVGHWYLDCGFGHWKPSLNRGVCDPYTPWPKFYQYRPWQEYSHREATLGGEVCLWTEEVEVDTLETRVWPRAAAFAERVWTDPNTHDLDDVARRLTFFNERLKIKGIRTSAMWPRWCTLNPGRC